MWLVWFQNIFVCLVKEIGWVVLKVVVVVVSDALLLISNVMQKVWIEISYVYYVNVTFLYDLRNLNMSQFWNVFMQPLQAVLTMASEKIKPILIPQWHAV